jgi:hypothetical protein
VYSDRQLPTLTTNHVHSTVALCALLCRTLFDAPKKLFKAFVLSQGRTVTSSSTSSPRW